MRYFASLIIKLCFMASLLVMSIGANAASIPKMEGETLDKVERVYPKDFNGKSTMMVVLFDQDQQEQLDGWADAISDLPQDMPMVEIALIGKVNGMVKYFIKGGMRDLYEDSPARMARMMPYFGDADKVKKRMKITDITKVHAFLLSASGKVLWQASGDYQGQFLTIPDDLK